MRIQLNNLITLQNVSFSYPEQNHTVLDSVSLEIHEGEFLAVLGYNGSGKSTMAKLFNGILLPSDGDVIVDGLNTKDENNITEIRKRVGMVFQNPDNQIVATIVEEDIAFAAENLAFPPEEIERRVTNAIAAVGLEKHRFDAPYKLSGGQKQRVAIAGILAMEPKCIVLDEPTAMLDPVGRQLVMNVIRRLHDEQGITVVLITHFMEEAAQADRVIVLSDGTICEDGTPREIFSKRERMLELGLDVPVSTQFVTALNELGIPIEKTVITPEQVLSAFYTLTGGKK